jgi:hypothetical protein
MGVMVVVVVVVVVVLLVVDGASVVVVVVTEALQLLWSEPPQQVLQPAKAVLQKPFVLLNAAFASFLQWAPALPAAHVAFACLNWVVKSPMQLRFPGVHTVLTH